MSDTTVRYKGFGIAKNQIGYRVLNLSYTPIFSSLVSAKKWIGTLPRELAKQAPCRCKRCRAQ